MRAKLRCMVCHEEHKNDSKHFPVTRSENRVVKNDPGKNPPVIMKSFIIGHVCRKCVHKRMVEARRRQG